MLSRRRIAASRWARVAALPIRTGAVVRHVTNETTVSWKWLTTSREHHNYTYELTPRNYLHLAWWISSVTGRSIDQCKLWIREVLEDRELSDHIKQCVERSDRRGLADADMQMGRRAGWYALIRALEPEHVVETGTDKGLGSIIIAAALLRNGHGRLTTMDINSEAGYLVSGRYEAVTNLIIGDSLVGLQSLTSDVGIFIHDSDHSYDHERNELTAVAPYLVKGARVISDNAHASDSLAEWAESTGRKFSYFREVPENHWYSGAGIGAAW